MTFSYVCVATSKIILDVDNGKQIATPPPHPKLKHCVTLKQRSVHCPTLANSTIYHQKIMTMHDYIALKQRSVHCTCGRLFVDNVNWFEFNVENHLRLEPTVNNEHRKFSL